jgi:hypothetical protein
MVNPGDSHADGIPSSASEPCRSPSAFGLYTIETKDHSLDQNYHFCADLERRNMPSSHTESLFLQGLLAEDNLS